MPAQEYGADSRDLSQALEKSLCSVAVDLGRDEPNPNPNPNPFFLLLFWYISISKSDVALYLWADRVGMRPHAVLTPAFKESITYSAQCINGNNSWTITGTSAYEAYVENSGSATQ